MKFKTNSSPSNNNYGYFIASFSWEEEDNNNFFRVISFCEIIGNEEGNAQESLFLFRLKDYYLNLNFDMIFAFPWLFYQLYIIVYLIKK